MQKDFYIDINNLDISKNLSKEEINKLNMILNSEKEIIFWSMEKFKKFTSKIKIFFWLYFIFFFSVAYLIFKKANNFQEFFLFVFVFLGISIIIFLMFFYEKYSIFIENLNISIKNNIYKKICFYIDENYIYNYKFKNENYISEIKKELNFLNDIDLVKNFNQFYSEDYSFITLEKNLQKIKIFSSEISKNYKIGNWKNTKYINEEHFYLIKIIFEKIISEENKNIIKNLFNEDFTFYISGNILYIKRNILKSDFLDVSFGKDIKKNLETYIKFYLEIKKNYIFINRIIEIIQENKNL